MQIICMRSEYFRTKIWYKYFAGICSSSLSKPLKKHVREYSKSCRYSMSASSLVIPVLNGFNVDSSNTCARQSVNTEELEKKISRNLEGIPNNYFQPFF